MTILQKKNAKKIPDVLQITLVRALLEKIRSTFNFYCAQNGFENMLSARSFYMMMIAFITFKSSLVPLLEGL